MRIARQTTRHAPRLAVAAALATLVAMPAAAAAPTTGAAPPADAPTAPSSPTTLAAATAADSRIASKLTSRATTSRFGTAFSGTVMDAGTGRIVWSTRRTTTLMPASNTKLFTAATALNTFGPDRRFTTYVRRGARANQVVLVGAGDPLLSSAKIRGLARATKDWIDAQGYKHPRVYVDDYFFPSPSLAYGWKSSYVPEDVTPVRAIVRDNRDLMNTSTDAGRYFAASLRALGVSDAQYAGRQDVANTRRVLARVNSVTVAGMVRRMLLTSDNDVAEILLRRTSYQLRNGTRWTGAKATQSEGAAAQGLGLGVLYDGSGLSRADRLSSGQVAALLRTAVTGSNPKVATIRSTNVLPTAGRTGTLEYRFTSSASDCAVGKVWAKTGTLADATALSGYTVGTDGRRKIFSFIVNGRATDTTLRNDMDMLAATVNGCY
ncbi:D-alanyl-D-alanine carboxypeptidase/D-alanyl-D-alanine-endopeptidase [Phycicoccus flavus]|uniref:D-alanyl-D-alanine carboxypeptidase/D-alanyl-D-alanine-endopeptidase n=1 Tax=Phycicoccus flavus TaxID=2502783 RepID=UPI000FEBFD61|nr:D-alanyl-D-alanine carboxypeptidase [Phycicoccus flavus]NHA67466.1 D-alanyl-D-alanine carboxypeptidase/D-alanyl-D-alanine-endopeptidase [Phycicoccus flavus]